ASDRLEQFSKGDSENFESVNKARLNLYAAQCNCAYWHGVFGGLYLPHLRSAIYENIIRAEKFMTPELDQVEETLYDYDCDGHDEIIVTTNKLTATIKPSMGGMMIELDNHEAALNITDTLRRRKEGYHWKLASAKLEGETDNKAGEKTESIHDLILTKESGLQEILTDDWHLKRCFIDHFLPADVNIEKFASGHFGDDGDFVLEPWQYDQSGKGAMPGLVKLVRSGHIWRNDGVTPLKIEKTFFFGKNAETIKINYSLTASEDILNLRFGVENNFNLLAGHADNRYVLFNGQKPNDAYLDAVNAKDQVGTVMLKDEWINTVIAVRNDVPSEVWQTPIFTVSLSEGGFEKVYQGTTILSLYNLNLKKDLPAELGFMIFTGKAENIPPMFQ
ncbi:MAG: alpha-amylase/4-alpha-glucanotransferase domain-containing protein, partial [Candidatus Zixiibacteriota bacterium]